MKLRLTTFGKSGRKGMALLIVLSVLVLLTILVVGFLSRASLDRTSASAYSYGSRNGQLADYAVNIVQAQIDHAVSQQDTAWASQPGMVRTFRQDGSLLTAYKLYSDSDMAAVSVDVAAATTALAGWQSSPAHFIDLNEPVEVDGRKEFAILDPSALDEDSGGKRMVEGFEVTNAPASPTQPVPMPVRWLYLLESGQVVAPSNVSGSSATIPGATVANQIVGRIAFWTDDETCKLNINTAAHGQFWDIPRAFSLEERDRMARFQPALREYQRYPGHPATTSLWPVLGYKVQDPDPVKREKDFGDFVFSLAPRVTQGGSEGGTKFASAAAVTLDNDRLFVSTDELLFSATNGNRQAQTGLDRADMERTKFFLTARSNSPEVNLFRMPRMAIWPVNAGTKTPSTLDDVIAFCSTISGNKYYLQRSDAQSSTADLKLDVQPDGKGRNEQLFAYVNALLKKPVPGFGNRTFVQKYTEAETDQITTSIFDYVRSSNLYSTALGATPYTGTGANPRLTEASRVGQVTPLKIGDRKGFGRFPAISQALLHFHTSGLRSGTREFPSNTYPMQTGKVPYYSDSFAAGSYKSVRDFLKDSGTSQDVELLTSGIIYFDTFDPMLGNAVPRYSFDVDVTFSGAWTVNDKSLGFQNATLNIRRDQNRLYNAKFHNTAPANQWVGTYYGRFYGGHLGPLWLMQNYTYVRNNPVNTAGGVALAYPLASDRIAIGQTVRGEDENLGVPPLKITLPPHTEASGTMSFSGGTLTAEVKTPEGEVVQTYTFEFPPFTKPAPTYAPRGYIGATSRLPYTDADVVLKQLATSADFKNRWAQQPNTHLRSPVVDVATTRLAALESNPSLGGADFCDLWLLQDMDTVVALEPAFGDKRILAALPELKTGAAGDADAHFVPSKDYASTTLKIAADIRNEPFGFDRRTRAFRTGSKPGRLIDQVYGTNAMADIPSRFPNGVKSTTDGNFWPDFDNGVLQTPDDAYINRADEGSVSSSIPDSLSGSATGDRGFPWYRNESFDTLSPDTFFSPNKQIASAGMFGSLPTGAMRNKPWQTLLFRPDPGNHPGALAPADALLLDLFWMPVVEPYAISERFSSNGKVNMNYQIMPFGGYLHRSTALRGVLQKQEVATISGTIAYRGATNGTANAATGYAGILTTSPAADDDYKTFSFGSSVTSFSQKSIRRTLNLSSTNGTLKAFEDLFAQNQIFRSETQICSVPLIPSDATWSANFESSYWDARRITGDNSREMPYTQLLPRLTTRSNTYTVHFRVQSVRKGPSNNPAEWVEATGKVTSELRGSRTIERYVNPNDTRIPDYAAEYAANPSAQPQSLDAFYRWRTLYNRTFAP